jgi:hypothetical protein
MAIHRLHFEEFDEIDYELIAIHTSLEDYRLAYFLNQKLPILLSKNKNEIQLNIKEGSAYFSRFCYDNFEKDSAWNLIQNKHEVAMNNNETKQNLFENTMMNVGAKVFLLPEMKKVDFFLKIENSEIPTDEIIKKINSIKSLSTAYSVETNQIKSKNNLIF